MRPRKVFIHGLESTSQGAKAVFFRERYPDMIIEDFWGTFPERMVKLEDLLATKTDLTLVGSSYGGLMSAVFACLHEARVKKLVLLAPALHLEPFEPYLGKKLSIPTVIFHGLQDDVVPPESIRDIARRLFINHEFNAVDDDHSLHRTFATLNWDALLNC